MVTVILARSQGNQVFFLFEMMTSKPHHLSGKPRGWGRHLKEGRETVKNEKKRKKNHFSVHITKKKQKLINTAHNSIIHKASSLPHVVH